MADLDVEFTHVSVCTECFADNDTDLLEFVEFVSDVSPPPFLTSKDVYVDPLTVLFRGPPADDLPTVSGGPLGTVPPDTEVTALRTTVDRDEYRLRFDEDETWISFEGPAIVNVAPDDVGDEVMEHVEDSRTRLEEGI